MLSVRRRNVSGLKTLINKLITLALSIDYQVPGAHDGPTCTFVSYRAWCLKSEIMSIDWVRLNVSPNTFLQVKWLNQQCRNVVQFATVSPLFSFFGNCKTFNLVMLSGVNIYLQRQIQLLQIRCTWRLLSTVVDTKEYLFTSSITFTQLKSEPAIQPALVATNRSQLGWAQANVASHTPDIQTGAFLHAKFRI